MFTPERVCTTPLCSTPISDNNARRMCRAHFAATLETVPVTAENSVQVLVGDYFLVDLEAAVSDWFHAGVELHEFVAHPTVEGRAAMPDAEALMEVAFDSLDEQISESGRDCWTVTAKVRDAAERLAGLMAETAPVIYHPTMSERLDVSDIWPASLSDDE